MFGAPPMLYDPAQSAQQQDQRGMADYDAWAESFAQGRQYANAGATGYAQAGSVPHFERHEVVDGVTGTEGEAVCEKLNGQQVDGCQARERRTLFLSDASEAWARVRDVLAQLNQEIIGPYTLGDQLSLADLHLAAWLARLITLAGGTLADDGTVAIGKLEAHVGGPGGGFALVKDFSVAEARRRAGLTVQDPESRERQNRLAAFWDAVRERQSFKNVYKDGLH
ncbi:hypothetical protein EVJ58_g8546 [Rhodofomes roseus]|uniref:Glutathione S-transferase n=1 Tax=Rhodofomes roseus TaxID=34475 RepID=A0A4Y9XZ59_9APHY|nr:hypothetical protein EVJ58_g8546 [Rhodofomes roseus]